jgi:hypothetical protein
MKYELNVRKELSLFKIMEKTGLWVAMLIR